MHGDADVRGQQFRPNKVVLPVQCAFHPVMYSTEQTHKHAVP